MGHVSRDRERADGVFWIGVQVDWDRSGADASCEEINVCIPDPSSPKSRATGVDRGLQDSRAADVGIDVKSAAGDVDGVRSDDETGIHIADVPDQCDSATVFGDGRKISHTSTDRVLRASRRGEAAGEDDGVDTAAAHDISRDERTLVQEQAVVSNTAEECVSVNHVREDRAAVSDR